MINIYEHDDHVGTITHRQLGYHEYDWRELNQEQKESVIAGFIENEGMFCYGWSWQEE